MIMIIKAYIYNNFNLILFIIYKLLFIASINIFFDFKLFIKIKNKLINNNIIII